MSENINTAAPHDSPHRHERELGIPPTLDSEGRCLVCHLEDQRGHMLLVAADLERERNELKGENYQLRERLGEAHLARIEAQNPGIDTERVRAEREMRSESDRAYHWRDIAFRSGADKEKLREVLNEAVKALVQHRTDMNQASPCPCSTCAFSEKVLAHARVALDNTEPKPEPSNADEAGE